MTSAAQQAELDGTPEGAPSSAVDSHGRARMLGRAGSYDLLVEIASGGMATVFLARGASSATEPSRLAAVKRPHPHLAKDPTYTSMLLDESRLASAIHHPNVVRVRELGFEGELPFIVMDYVEGASLIDLRRELAEAQRALDVPVALRIVLDALAGLSAAHALTDANGRSLGIIHRDVSPHNVLVGSDGVSRLTDFGVAKADDRVQITRTHEVKGKLSYMAPERVDRRRLCTVQSDVFAMAIVLWESLAGRRLFKGDEPAHVLDAVLNMPIPKLRARGAMHVPPELDLVIARGLSRDLGIRYATAADFAQALEGASGGRIASREDVARVIETVFSPRLRTLQESVRRVLGDDDTEQLFLASGLRMRPRPTPSMPLSTPEIYAAIGSEVPSDRYVIDELPEPAPPPKRKWPVVAAVGVGAVIGIAGIALMAARDRGASAKEASLAAPTPASETVAAPLLVPATPATPATPDPPASASAAPSNDAVVAPAPPARPMKPNKSIGTRRNGFTKLK